MDNTLALLLVAALGVAVGVGFTSAYFVSVRRIARRNDVTSAEIPADIATLLTVLRSGALVVDEYDEVLQATAPAYNVGLVSGRRLTVDALVMLVREVRRSGERTASELEIPRGRGIPPAVVTVRVAPLGPRLVLVLVEDRTRERRVEALRRDFVVNVSHELKTPVGALTLLSEAVQDAADDPEAIQRFAARMQTEASRLNKLVQQIIELSRLQGDDLNEEPSTVSIDAIVEQAVDHAAIEAQAKGIDVVRRGAIGLTVLGSEGQLATALSNLVANAIAYSPELSKVVVTTTKHTDSIEVAVTDQGIGIPAAEIERIFERFYRVDPARHRSTGGTGLGLSIVKHVAASHGGDIKVWSAESQGSTFTLRLPRGVNEEPAPANVRSL